jgi:hypothetical protein
VGQVDYQIRSLDKHSSDVLNPSSHFHDQEQDPATPVQQASTAPGEMPKKKKKGLRKAGKSKKDQQASNPKPSTYLDIYGSGMLG